MPAECCVKTLKKMLQPEHADEPVFLLRAQDKLAPAILSEWLWQAQAAGSPKEKLDAGQRHLVAMREWQAEHPERVKVPD